MARSFIATSSQYILVNSAPSINLGSGDFTVALWVRFPTVPPDNSMIIGKRDGGFDGDTGWELKFDDALNGDIRWDIDTDSAGNKRVESDIPAIIDGDWHLLAGDRDADLRMRLWFDGTIVNQRVEAITGNVDTTTPLVIGAAYDTPSLTNYLTGNIGPIFICRRVLSDAEHAWLAQTYAMRFLKPAPCFLMEMISRAAANEPDIANGLLGGLGNAPAVVDNPRIIFPVGQYTGQDLFYEFANATIAAQSAVTATIGRLIAGEGSTIAAQSAATATMSANVAPKAAIVGQSSATATASVDASVGSVARAQSAMTASLTSVAPVASSIVAQSAMSAIASPLAGATATVVGQSAMSATGDRIRTLSCSIGGQSAMTSAATITAGMSALISCQSAFAALLSATVPAAATVAAQSSAEATASAKVPVAATIGGQSVFAAAMTRVQPASATIAAQSAASANATALAPVSATIVAQSGMTAGLSAQASLEATIAARSAAAVLPTYPGEPKTITVGGYIRWLDKVKGWIS